MQRNCIILATSPQLRLSRCCHLAGLRDKSPYQVVARHASVHHRKYCTKNVPKVQQVVYDPKPDMSEEEVKHLKIEPILPTHDPRSKRYALLLSFNGQGFHGMQRNATLNSVEDHLHKAMLQADVITQEEFLVPQLFNFQRASRTDKGVSAARLLTTGRFFCEKSELKEKVNQLLCDQIRLMAVFKVINNFSCKTWCDARTYSYTCPTFAFASFTEVTEEGYRLSENALEEVRTLFAQYKGIHNFHNFTSGIKPENRQALRQVLDIECGKPFEQNGLEWITIKIKGASFLLHQIRKMISVVIVIRRGLASTNFISQALSRDYTFLPIAPGLGLVLEDQHYDYYNKKIASSNDHLDALVWDAEAGAIEEFRQRAIMTPIMDTELRERSMLKWLSTLYTSTFEMNKIKKERLPDSPLALIVQTVQHHIAAGNSVCDAVTEISDLYNGKQSSDSTVAINKVSLGS
ncbi:pseudouridylate synthase 1 homolog isoform X2 [Eriocheir sinensis]|nr:pseudouridylate synthase 1 homolog isoform X2 [Eriocheir sinensis]